MTIPISPSSPMAAEQRIGNPVTFPEVLDLKEAGLLLDPDSPLGQPPRTDTPAHSSP